MKIILTLMILICSISAAFGFDYSREESVKYDVSFMKVPVVRVSLQSGPISDSDSGAYRIQIEAQTTKFWSMFYPVDNFYWTYLDTIGLPLIYSRKINEKSLKKNTQQTFDHSRNRIYYEGNTAIDHPWDWETFFSSLYRLRAASMWIGYVDSFYVNAEKASWKVVCRVEATETIEVVNRDIPCYRIDVKFIAKDPDAVKLKSDILTYNLISEDTVLKLYLTMDDWRLPVRMQYELSPFDLVANMTEAPSGYPELKYTR